MIEHGLDAFENDNCVKCQDLTPMIERNFSRYAALYDEYADIQNIAAEGLIKKLPMRDARRILDIGCGTGNYTLLLRRKFGDAGITALDISREMIDIARKKCARREIDFIVADAERFAVLKEFDLVTSNASFQWFNELELSVAKYKEALTPGGSILFSTFGPATFNELARSIKEALGVEASISAFGFSGKERLRRTMERYFSDCSVDEIIIKRVYSSLEEILRHIKYTGARGGGVSGIALWTKRMLDRIEEKYRSNFGELEVSYQIFYCRGSR